MCGKLFSVTFFVFTLSLISSVAFAGVDFGDPDGGWTYIYTGDAAAPGADYTALDGTWNHDNGSDSWDESEIGTGNPGGVSILTEDVLTFARIQDTGDPRDYGASDPSNRKFYFTHRMSDDGVDPAIANTILDDGVTISFRARLATTPPLDDLHEDGGSTTSPWPAEGNGYAIHHGGKGNFCVHQGEAEADGQIAFSLILAGDEQGGAKNPDRSGLCMPNLNGNAISGDIDIEGNDAGTLNLFDIEDLTIWHEFWITIEADATGTGTHLVKIYMDGSSIATEFIVTASNETENAGEGPNIGLGMGSTASHGAFDVDFFAYKAGIISPTPSDPYKARAINPVPGSTVALADAKTLGWTAGESATEHDIYFGTSESDVNDTDTTNTTGIYRGRQSLVLYTLPEALELGKTYYWRIDEVEADGTTIHTGNVWSFSILDHILIDDFEDYDNSENQIWFAWHDGLGYGETGIPPFFAGNGTGAAVGDENTNSFTEETIVHDGRKSMPYMYNNNKDGFLNYSEATKTLTEARDWTDQDVKALSLWFRGYPPYLGGFAEAPAGTFTVSGEGTDIEGNSDQFHFAWQQLSGAGSITVRIQSIQDTDPWAKAGVMIRDTLDADSAQAMMAVTPGNGVWFGRRTAAGNATDTDSQAGLTTPILLKLERTLGGLMRASYSTNGFSWTQLGASIAINMNTPIYIGLAVTSHNPGEACEAVFSSVTSDGTGPWTDQDIGLRSNQAEPMYIRIANNSGTSATVNHEDPNATLISIWTQWNIDLKDFSDQGVDLTDVNSITIGFGDPVNPQPGGSGKMFIDDIRLYQARYVPDKVTPLKTDFTGDGVVDIKDFQILMNDWLQGDYTVSATTPQPPASWWKLDNNTNDSNGGITGTTQGNPTFVTGNSGQAIDLDGDDSADLGNPPSLDFSTGDWTISAWIKTTQSGTGDENKGSIYAKGGDQTDGIRYTLGIGEVTSGLITLTTDDNVTKAQATGTTVVNDDLWHHVVGVRSGTRLLVYVDGALDGTGTVPAGYDLSGTTQHNAYIGAITDNRDGTIFKYFIGLIDDVQIYDYALSDTDILSVAGLTEMYFPLTSPANVSDDEPVNSKTINFKDFAMLAAEWLQQLLWPSW
jgi:hypothetical protein